MVRVPYIRYGKYQFSKLLDQGGVWDQAGNQFIFELNKNVEEFSRKSAGKPCVLVDVNSSVPVRVFGLSLWEDIQKEDIITDKTPYNVPHTEKSRYFPENWQIKLEAELRSRKYSKRTIGCYLYYNQLLCRTLQKSPEQILPEDCKQFLAIIEKDKEYSASSMNLAISAIKFFYTNILKKNIISEKTRPIHDKKLPMVLDKAEIAKILSLEKNIKHRLLLMLVYSSGLRVSEVVSIKKEHIDLSRKVLYIKLGKGRKDRYTILSEKAAHLLKEYIVLHDIQNWLFPGQHPTRHLSIRSAQYIFDNAVHAAQIQKKVSIHSLRHTFATHLLENGTDIRYIQSLLGHASLRATERYTHVARRSILNIKSPLDTI